MAWSRMISSRQLLLSNLRKGVCTNSTLDNNNGRQETMTVAGTTHNTNKTLSQLRTNKEKENIETIGSEAEQKLDICDNIDNEQAEVAPYLLGKHAGPPIIPNYADKPNASEEVDACFEKDIVWSAAGSLPLEIDGKELRLLGSWTSFNKMVSNVVTEKCVQEYLPVTAEPPEYPVCKEYLDFLLEIMVDLEVPYIFVHSDEAVYSKLCHILWKNQDLYKNIVLLMGGFHQLRVRQKIALQTA